MQKILTSAVLGILLAGVLAPLAVSAAGPVECCNLKKAIEIDGTSLSGIVGPTEMVQGTDPGKCPAGAVAGANITTKWGLYCLINTINTVVDWVFTVLIVLAVLFTILGAFEILTAGGSPEKVTTGRNYILYAVIGLAVAFIARAIPGIAKSIMGI
jgi:hypothetical protein